MHDVKRIARHAIEIVIIMHVEHEVGLDTNDYHLPPRLKRYPPRYYDDDDDDDDCCMLEINIPQQEFVLSGSRQRQTFVMASSYSEWSKGRWKR
jgi:hypothetical protein